MNNVLKFIKIGKLKVCHLQAGWCVNKAETQLIRLTAVINLKSNLSSLISFYFLNKQH